MLYFHSQWVRYLEARFGLIVAGLAEAGSEKFRGQRPGYTKLGSVEWPGACPGNLYSGMEANQRLQHPCRVTQRPPSPQEHEDEANQGAAEMGKVCDASTEQRKTGNTRQ